MDDNLLIGVGIDSVLAAASIRRVNGGAMLDCMLADTLLNSLHYTVSAPSVYRDTGVQKTAGDARSFAVRRSSIAT